MRRCFLHELKNKIRLALSNHSHSQRGKSSIIVLLWWFIQGTFSRYSIHNIYSWRNFLLLLLGANIGEGVKIRSTAKFTYPWKVKIGDYSWIGDNVELYSLDKIDIGSNCVISQKSYLCAGTHNVQDPHFGLITRPI